MSVQIETDTHVNIMMWLFEYIYASNQVIVQIIFGQLKIISFFVYWFNSDIHYYLYMALLL